MKNLKFKAQVLRTVVVTAGIPTATGLIYNEDCLKELYKQARPMVAAKTLLGWISRAEYTSEQWDDITSSKSQACLMVTSIFLKKEKGKPSSLAIEVTALGTQDGRFLSEAIDAGIRLSLGLRAIGKLMQGSLFIDPKELKLLGVDVLA